MLCKDIMQNVWIAQPIESGAEGCHLSISKMEMAFSVQESFNAIERCRWPVIAAVHGESFAVQMFFMSLIFNHNFPLTIFLRSFGTSIKEACF